jgi:hypothetical protein
LEIMPGTTEHLPLDQLQPRDLAFGLPIAPRQLQRRPDRSLILLEPVGERPQLAVGRVGQPAVELVGLPWAGVSGAPRRRMPSRVVALTGMVSRSAKRDPASPPRARPM